MRRKMVAHLFQLPRWFALPYFGGSIILGAVIAGGVDGNAWLAVVAGLLVMASGHAWNSFLDYAWTGLDKGVVESRSAEKIYTGGQNLIENHVVSLREVVWNACGWMIVSAVPILYLAYNVTPLILVPWIAGLLVTFWYSWGKFNWTHELSLGVAVGPIPAFIGALAVNPSPPWLDILLASVPFAIVLSFAGLALDEWEDAEANLEKGVKSMAFEVWKHSGTRLADTPLVSSGDGQWVTPQPPVKNLDTLRWYLTAWFLFMFVYQGLLIYLEVLRPLTGLSFLAFPFLIACMLMLRANFRKWAAITVIVGAVYVILLVVGQIM